MVLVRGAWGAPLRLRRLAAGPDDKSVAVRVGTIRQTVAAIGRVEPFTEVTLANKIPGRIREVLVKEGDPVKRGQVVIRFDDAEPAAGVRMSEARIAHRPVGGAAGHPRPSTAPAPAGPRRRAARGRRRSRGRGPRWRRRSRSSSSRRWSAAG